MVADTETIKDQIGIGPGRIGDGGHGHAICSGPLEEVEQSWHGFKRSAGQVAETGFLAIEHSHGVLKGQGGQETSRNVSVSEALQLRRIARLVEMVAVRSKGGVERPEMQGVGVGQGAVDVEQKGCARGRDHGAFTCAAAREMPAAPALNSKTTGRSTAC